MLDSADLVWISILGRIWHASFTRVRVTLC
jgi:hypothetical protein